MSDVGENIKTECDKRDWTISHLAKESGIPQQTIHGWTTGRSPSLEQLRQVADVLQVPLYQLAFGSHDPHEIETDVILKELFSGDIRVTLQKIERKKK